MDFSESAYGALLEEIFLRFPSVQKTDFARAYKPGLEGMEAFCEALGHPERSFRSICPDRVAKRRGGKSLPSRNQPRRHNPRTFAEVNQMRRSIKTGAEADGG